MGRDPDESGLQEWARKLTSGEACGVSVAYGFVYSQEFQDNNYDNATYTEKMYNMLLGRESDAEGKAYWVERLDNGESKDAIFYGFSNSQEFFNLCESYGIFAGHYVSGIGMDRNSDINCFVNRFYEVCLGRKGDIAGQTGWVEQLSNGSMTGSALAIGFIFSSEYIAKNTSNEEYVKTLYTTFLGREADEAGLEGWTEVLDNGTKSREEVFDGFCASPEFDALCTKYGIVRGEGIGASSTPSTQPTAQPTPEVNYPIDINIYSDSSEEQKAIEDFIATHPEFAARYNVSVNFVQSSGEITSEEARNNGDLFIVDASMLDLFTCGELAQNTASYKDLFEDFDKLVSQGELAQYSMNLGTRLSDGAVVGISYQASQGMMLYRRSIAKEVFGTDDPAEIERIFGAGSGNLDSFLSAASTLKGKGYATTSSMTDIFQMLRFSKYAPHIVNNELTVNSTDWAYSLDTVNQIIDNGYTNNNDAYTEAWYADMSGTGDRQVFCYLAPMWQIEYVNSPSCGDTAGDWAVCKPPMNSFQGGRWVLASQSVIGTAKEEAIKELINYMLFDTSENGLQYKSANGKLNNIQTPVASRKIMSNASYTVAITGDQNVFEVIANLEDFSIPAPSAYDSMIYSLWYQDCLKYADDMTTKDGAISDFLSFFEEFSDITIKK